MLRANRKVTGEIVEAYFANKAQAPFECPECGDPVIFKSGKTKVNYFAHENPLACVFNTGESELHENCKWEIFDGLRQCPSVRNVVLERHLGSVRPDVSAVINGVPVAIEVQISSLSIETITRRTIDYHQRGIYVLWLLQWTPKLDLPRYAPRLWEKWIHAAYFGRVFYWIEGLKVVSYHFEHSFKTVPKKTWYSANGKKMTGGGFSQKLKRSRTAVRGRVFNLATDFAPKQREWWEASGIKVPDAKLFMEKPGRANQPDGFRRRKIIS